MRVASCAVLIAALALWATARPSAAEPLPGILVHGRTLVFEQAPARPLPAIPFNNAKIQLIPAPDAKPIVVCGMTLIPADPKIDPKIHARPPTRDIKPLIRTIPPRECQAPAKPSQPR
jgi:hypothetical protein